MSDYHELPEYLDEKTRAQVRALNSLKEEIEAVDWYNQRVAATEDPELKEILEHNRDEEIEHCAMLIEYLRRNMDAWDDELRTYLFTTDNILEVEEKEEAEGNEGPASGDLGIGQL